VSGQSIQSVKLLWQLVGQNKPAPLWLRVGSRFLAFDAQLARHAV